METASPAPGNPSTATGPTSHKLSAKRRLSSSPSVIHAFFTIGSILLDVVLTVLASLWRSHRCGLEFTPCDLAGACGSLPGARRAAVPDGAISGA